ncbi:MAG: hypothetical protein ACOY16_06030 [Chloroflexota bacterium]
MKTILGIIIAGCFILTISCTLTEKLLPNVISKASTSTSSPTLPPTPTDTPTITITPLPSSTPTPDKTATKASSNATVQAKLTQTAQPMVNLVQKLYEEGFISSSQGSVKNLSDFSEAWAQLDWYRWWYQLDERKYSNFVLSFDAEMKSASDKANWDFAGCGIVFHTIDKDNHYVLIIAQDGTLTLSRRVNDVGQVVKKSKQYTTSIPVENIHVVLAVDGIQVVVLINGSEVLSARDSILGSKLSKGKIGFSVLSGTNKGYGTRCSMKNIQFWEIK